jgi:YtxH-like protein
MSFADPNPPRSGTQRTESPRNSTAVRTDIRRGLPPDDEDVPTVERPRGSPYRRSIDWEHVGLLGAGLLVGALVGAGAALLLAPQTGLETRTAIRRRARFARHRARDAWSELADELAAATRRGGRRARRALRRARWRASDAIA